MFRNSFVAVLALLAFGGICASEPAKLTIHADQSGIKVSPTLYGIFFEEINRAGDGGIYAEMVQNRSFEDADKPNAWSIVKSPDDDVSIALDKTHPLNEKNPTSLRLEVKKVASRAGVANEGFKGIAVKQGETYLLDILARREKPDSTLLVAIESKDGKVLASAKGNRDGNAFRFALTANETDPAARLVVALTAPGTVNLDMVSLKPIDTFKGHPFRKDLAQLLADMKPGFVRFPGGCFVEGNIMRDAFRWKDTIGDIAQRPGHWNLWGYRSTDGLGYHEYLQLCEDIGAEPLYVINCGMSHKENVPMDKMGEFVQDALDAIEYANGPADSKWGALRQGRPSRAVQHEVHGDRQRKRRAGLPRALRSICRCHQSQVSADPARRLRVGWHAQEPQMRDHRRALLQHPRVLHGAGPPLRQV